MKANTHTIFLHLNPFVYTKQTVAQQQPENHAKHTRDKGAGTLILGTKRKMYYTVNCMIARQKKI